MKVRSFLVTAALSLLASSAAYADVQITMANGRVTIVAKDATLRQILTEWARVGQTKIVNVERIPGAPMTIELRDMPEDRALDVLMRTLSGYVAAPRAVQAPSLSRFDRIVVMPTLAAARQPTTATSAPPPPTFPNAPAFQTGGPVFQSPPPVPGQAEEAEEPAQPQNAPPRGPVFTAFPQPQVVNPNVVPGNGQQPTFVQPPNAGAPGATGNVPPPMVPSAVPTAPVGVAVPGMMVPTPGQAAPTATPVRRPGGL